jgi:Transposase DDE domain
VHVATTKRTYKGKVYTSYLLRRSIRDGQRVRHETLGNLSHLPPDLIDLIRRRLSNGAPLDDGDGWQIVRSLPHGHVVATLETIRAIGLDNVLASRSCRERDLVLAMLIARILEPGSKLATARGLKEETASSSLASELHLGPIADKELYQALDWLHARQQRIENKLAAKHLHEGTLVLYDVSSSYYTGRGGSLVQHGYSRDGRREFPQIVYGLLCNPVGCPVAIEVFAGNTADPNTLSAQVSKVRRRFGISRVVFVGDRGLITSKRIDEELRGVDGLDWITALRSDHIRQLVAEGTVAPSLFDERDLAEVRSPLYPDERLMVCRNPLLADRRRCKRDELLAATEAKLAAIAAATQRSRRPLRGQAAIGLRVGRVLHQFKMGKHFILHITDTCFSYQRAEAHIAEEAALDGLYVIRTSLAAATMSSEETVRAYKDLSKVERAFRSVKTVDLKVRPIFHWLDERIRAHVFLCMLAYYVEWHMRQKLAPLLFDDHERAAAEQERPSIVAPAPRSAAAQQKDASKQTDDGFAVHSFRTLLSDLATLTKNRVCLANQPGVEFDMLTRATPQQVQIFAHLGIAIPGPSAPPADPL